MHPFASDLALATAFVTAIAALVAVVYVDRYHERIAAAGRFSFVALVLALGAVGCVLYALAKMGRDGLTFTPLLLSFLAFLAAARFSPNKQPGRYVFVALVLTLGVLVYVLHPFVKTGQIGRIFVSMALSFLVFLAAAKFRPDKRQHKPEKVPTSSEQEQHPDWYAKVARQADTPPAFDRSRLHWLKYALPALALVFSTAVASARSFPSGDETAARPQPRPLQKGSIPDYMRLDTAKITRQRGAFVILLPAPDPPPGARLIRAVTLFDQPLTTEVSVVIETGAKERASLDFHSPGRPRTQRELRIERVARGIRVRLPSAGFPPGLDCWYAMAQSSIGYVLEGSFPDPRRIEKS